MTNPATVSNQDLSPDNTITVDSVTADAAGWLVIHAQSDGAPGPILGYAPVPAAITAISLWKLTLPEK